MSDSVQPHRRQPTRLLCPWDSPGKNTGVGCHFLLQCIKVKSESEVTQSCPTLSDSMDCSPPGSSVHGIFQARVLEWGAIAFSVDLLKPCLISASAFISSFPSVLYFVEEETEASTMEVTYNRGQSSKGTSSKDYIELPCDPAILFLHRHPKELKAENRLDICTPHSE